MVKTVESGAAWLVSAVSAEVQVRRLLFRDHGTCWSATEEIVLDQRVCEHVH